MTICNGVYTERQGRAMLNIGRWFSFSSPEERKEREEAYLQTVFPFGEAQKQLEQGLLKTCVQAPVNENEKLYQLLVVKGLYAQTRPEKLEDTLGKWYRGALLKKWPDSARAALLALAQLSLEAEAPEALPVEKQVLVRTAEIQKDLLPKLKAKAKTLWRR